MLYGDQQHRYNILVGRRTGYLNEKNVLNERFQSVTNWISLQKD